jgi:hypothetical protein
MILKLDTFCSSRQKCSRTTLIVYSRTIVMVHANEQPKRWVKVVLSRVLRARLAYLEPIRGNRTLTTTKVRTMSQRRYQHSISSQRDARLVTCGPMTPPHASSRKTPVHGAWRGGWTVKLLQGSPQPLEERCVYRGRSLHGPQVPFRAVTLNLRLLPAPREDTLSSPRYPPYRPVATCSTAVFFGRHGKLASKRIG